MVKIIRDLHKYVPQVEIVNQVEVEDANESVGIFQSATHNIMFGGDQLTKVRATSALIAKSNSDKPTTRMEGIIPVIEDWHAKMTLFEVKLTFIFGA